jgi:aspartate aminotransferase
MVKLAEGKSIVLKTTGESDYKITPAQLEAAITPATKVLMINSPSNPSGSIYSYKELSALVDVLKKHPQIWVISDEIYEYINYESLHVSIASFPEMIERTVIINGVSKGFAMTGWRIGFLAAPKHIAKACEKLQGQQTSGPSSISQMAAIAAYSGGLDATIEMRKAFRRRRDLILSLTKDIEGIKVNTPPGAFYIFPDISSYFGKQFNGKIIENADQLSMYLLEEGHVASVSGNAFGSPENIRLSYATSDESIIEAIKRLKKALQNLK